MLEIKQWEIIILPFQLPHNPKKNFFKKIVRG